MSQDYSKQDYSLTGLTNFINAQGVKLTANEKKTLGSIWSQAGLNSVASNCSGVNIFINLINTGFKKLYGLVSQYFNSVTSTKNKKISSANTTPAEITSLINKEIERKKHQTNNIDASEVDMKYWSNLISKVANKYNVSAEILVTIISRECGFKKHTSEVSGAGPMGITTAGIEDAMPKTKSGKKNEWYKIYDNMHHELLNDILKYGNNAADLRKKAGRDDELGILLGLLNYEMTYCKQVASKLYKKANFGTIPKAIEQVKKGFRLEDQNSIRKSLENYNGSTLKVAYGNDTIRCLNNLTDRNYKELVFKQ